MLDHPDLHRSDRVVQRLAGRDHYPATHRRRRTKPRHHHHHAEPPGTTPSAPPATHPAQHARSQRRVVMHGYKLGAHSKVRSGTVYINGKRAHATASRTGRRVTVSFADTACTSDSRTMRITIAWVTTTGRTYRDHRTIHLCGSKKS